MIDINNVGLGQIVTAIGGLGMASFALVDSSKALPGGGISNKGFAYIEAAVRLFELNPSKKGEAPDLAAALLQNLHANWINGVALADQKAIAKSLIKLRLTADSAARYAEVAGVDAEVLRDVARRMTSGEPLDSAQHTNTLGRFDLALTALLDAAYQRADQRYRNVSKTWAGFLAVALAVLGGIVLEANAGGVEPLNMLLWSLCGVLAVPLAPISKDLASALTAGVKVAQSLRR